MTDTCTERIQRTVVHYGKHLPSAYVGGVETFARNLQLVFEEVLFMGPKDHDFDRVRREGLPVICDNHWVLKVPRELPTIAFQHGVADVKRRVTRRLKDASMARRQRKAARRANTLWVACAEWIARRFELLYGNGAKHVVYHQVDLARFDGQLDNQGSQLVLHDARSVNKGLQQIRWLAEAFPQWRFEPLACRPEEVPDRMRKARAFVHLSKYEGNSIVCNEAMAHNLPCFFTRVGLFQDAHGPTEIRLVEPEVAFRDRPALIQAAGEFFESLQTQRYEPRRWVQEHASHAACVRSWQRVLLDFDAMHR